MPFGFNELSPNSSKTIELDSEQVPSSLQLKVPGESNTSKRLDNVKNINQSVNSPFGTLVNNLNRGNEAETTI